MFEKSLGKKNYVMRKRLHDITDPSKPEALKMDGAKLLADIVDSACESEQSSREACCWGRSFSVRRGGPCSKEDPARSST